MQSPILNPCVPWRGTLNIRGAERLLLPLYALVFALRCFLQDIQLLRSGHSYRFVALNVTFLRVVRNAMWRHGEVADRLVPFSR